MRKLLLLILMFYILLTPLPERTLADTTSSFVPSNPNATPEVKAMLKYLGDLPNHSGNRVLSGQNCGHGDELADPTGFNSYKRYIEDLHTRTGKYVAILSINYEYMNIYPPDRLHKANQYLIDYWKKGGLVAINYIPRNPFVDGGSGDPEKSDKSKVDMSKLIDPDSTYYSLWHKRLDVIAAALGELREAGVVVIWCPMQEMNGHWYWYGQKSVYKDVWIDMYNYFTKEKKLDNLLWVYDNAEASPCFDSSYPGDDYVDIVGDNPYNDSFKMDTNYLKLLRYGKVYACPETGFDLFNTRNPKNLTKLINSIRNKYPMTSYFIQWHNCGPTAVISLVDSWNAKKLLNDPWIVTRDEVNWKSYLNNSK